MTMLKFVREAVGDYINYLEIPQEIWMLINRAKRDLYYGPLYLSPEGDDASMYDEGAVAFDFVGACEQIREYLFDVTEDICVSKISGYWYSRHETEEIIEEGEANYEDFYLVEAKDVVEEIVGSELFNYVQ